MVDPVAVVLLALLGLTTIIVLVIAWRSRESIALELAAQQAVMHERHSALRALGLTISLTELMAGPRPGFILLTNGCERWAVYADLNLCDEVYEVTDGALRVVKHGKLIKTGETRISDWRLAKKAGCPLITEHVDVHE